LLLPLLWLKLRLCWLRLTKTAHRLADNELVQRQLHSTRSANATNMSHAASQGTQHCKGIAVLIQRRFAAHLRRVWYVYNNCGFESRAWD
jgi:hypothetical protein